ncbi:crossover junction endonuclease eme1, partial [Rhizophlyctis rosea]
RIVILVDGLEKYFAARKRQVGKQFLDEVQAALPGGGPAATAEGGKKGRGGGRQKDMSLAKLPDRKELAEAVMDLQIMFGKRVVVHEVRPGEDVARWVAVFTAQVAQRPELSHRSEATYDIRFGDQIKSGTDHADTWSKMLQHVALCTEARAKAITARYPTLRSLYEAYLGCASVQDGEGLLAGVQINLGTSVNPRMRNLGPALSKRIYESVMVDNPGHSLTLGE